MTIAICTVFMLLGLGAASTLITEDFDYTLIIAQVPHHLPARVTDAGSFEFKPSAPEHGRICALSSAGALVVLTVEFASAADPSLSFDARRVLFAGKRSPGDSWDIWEMDVDGNNKRQLTSNFGNCLEPNYLATSSITPPDFEDKVRWILFTSDQARTYEEQGTEPARAIYAKNIEPIAGRSTVTRRMTFNLSSDFSPTVISDGRVLFASRQPGGNSYAQGRFPLLVTNWDGTGLNLFCDSHEGGLLKTMACEMPDRTLVFVESEGETRDGAGQLARISFKRPLHSRELLSKSDGKYLNPRPVPDGRLLVSYSAGKESRALYLFDFNKGVPGRKIHQDGKWDDQLAIVVAERPEPQGLLSAVIDTDSTADLHCINVYDSDLPHAAEIKYGDVKNARLVEGIPVPTADARLPLLPGDSKPSNLRTRILGEVPVEADGSFWARVPADTPFYVQLLNAEGMVLETLRGWIWVRGGTSRQCLGCHENKELAPENRATDALVKLHRYSLLQPPEQRRMGADFKHSVMPIVQARCQSCHQGDKADRGPILSDGPTKYFNKAFEGLRGGPGYLRPGSAKDSPLIRMLMQAPSSAPSSMVNSGKHPAVALTENEKRTLVEWIDLGARWEN